MWNWSQFILSYLKGFRGVMGIVKHAGNFVIGNVSDLGQYI